MNNVSDNIKHKSHKKAEFPRFLKRFQGADISQRLFARL
jgi:hypothetical protein